MMSAAEAPRPWSRTMAAVACSSGCPVSRTGRPPWRAVNSSAPRPAGRARDHDRRQVELEVLPPALVLGRQLEGRAEGLGCFVHGEAGLVGCDLEEDPSRLPEIDRVEVLPVDDRGNLAAGLHQLLSPGQLLGVVGGSPGNVVHRADRLLAPGEIRVLEQLDQGAGGAVPGRQVGAATLASDLLEPHHLAQKAPAGLCVADAETDGVEASDSQLGIYGTLRPGHPAVV